MLKVGSMSITKYHTIYLITSVFTVMSNITNLFVPQTSPSLIAVAIAARALYTTHILSFISNDFFIFLFLYKPLNPSHFLLFVAFGR